ncbi:MAG: Serine/threonine-protein kinase PknB, partial [Labilithrix sp.]|nr:Serine/threonine-protein kinase PknB [Labilithrix sp.]
MSENDESLPRLLGGRYRLDAKLGSGGMGVVYRATDLTMKRAVAVKLIRGVDGVALDEEVAGRFLREAKNTARIQHEHIIEVFDLGRSDQGDMFFVMELLEGESLSTKLRRDGKLSPAVGVHIARQMCAALHVAHSAGIIHRDLKPANVMLIERAGQGDYVKVLDFGVAKSYTPDQQT